MLSRLNLARAAWVILTAITVAAFFDALPAYRALGSGYLEATTSRTPTNDVVLHPLPNGSAWVAGVREGDILAAVDGTPVDPQKDFLRLGTRGTVGTTVTLTVRRGTDLVTIPVVRSFHNDAVNRDLGLSARGAERYFFTLEMVPVLAFAIASVLTLLRSWNSTGGILLALAFMLVGPGGSSPVAFEAYTSWLAKIPTYAGGVAIGFTFAVFPNGRLAPRWAPLVIVAFATISILAVSKTVSDAVPASLQSLVWVLAMGLGVTAQVARYRKAGEVERRQVKVVLLSFLALLMALAIRDVPRAYFQSQYLWELNYRWVLYSYPLFAIAAASIPVSIAIAVQRHRLWNVDTIINRSAVYSIVTIVLAIVWAVSAVLLQLVLEVFIGSHSNIAAAAVSSLQVAALFQPLRAATQRWVDRKYPRDSQLVEQQLQQLTRDVVNATDLDVLPMLEQRLRDILGTSDVAWIDNRVMFTAPVAGRLKTKSMQKAIEAFSHATSPHIALRAAVRRALLAERVTVEEFGREVEAVPTRYGVPGTG